jgi:hypothetical protein
VRDGTGCAFRIRRPGGVESKVKAPLHSHFPEHDFIQPSSSVVAMPSVKCIHGKQKHFCRVPECGGGTAYCPHGKRKDRCPEPGCGSKKALCEHGVNKYMCGSCGTHYCEHSRQRGHCGVCDPRPCTIPGCPAICSGRSGLQMHVKRCHKSLSQQPDGADDGIASGSV